MSSSSNRSSLIAVRWRGPVRSIWRRMQCTLRSPASLMCRMNRNRRLQGRATAERKPTSIQPQGLIVPDPADYPGTPSPRSAQATGQFHESGTVRPSGRALWTAGSAERSFGSPFKIQGKSQRVLEPPHYRCATKLEAGQQSGSLTRSFPTEVRIARLSHFGGAPGAISTWTSRPGTSRSSWNP